MAIDLPHPWPLPLGWQSARPLGFWVNKHFLLSSQSGVQIESSKKAWKNISSGRSCAADRTFEKCLSFIDGLNMIVSLLALPPMGPYIYIYKGTFTRANAGLECIKGAKSLC